ncbi:MAG: isopentenyl phosphate kinase family protein [Anaerolineales bacterium]|nr:isopentenyl phosphate kinase family protein [Chloroflexota bacterium]MBL6983651.1 isopentenyl phosphate kinase family protein [Anaerolineales bacterium]
MSNIQPFDPAQGRLQYSNLQFLKLGGSLITDKYTPHSPRIDVIARLAQEIKTALNENDNLRLVLGHGSGSFGHVPAKKYGTRQGVDSTEGWRGFAEVWYEASSLNRIVIDAFQEVGLPVVAFPPSGAVTTSRGQVTNWNVDPIRHALDAGILPVVYGDVVFDEILGGTILSTEDLFMHLAQELKPRRISLAGIDEGVWADYPQCTQLIPEITPGNWDQIAASIGNSAATDVTGGMASKVKQMLDLVEGVSDLEVLIFSGDQPKNVFVGLNGEIVGTQMHKKTNV